MPFRWLLLFAAQVRASTGSLCRHPETQHSALQQLRFAVSITISVRPAIPDKTHTHITVVILLLMKDVEMMLGDY
jgi:hypothetical protein